MTNDETSARVGRPAERVISSFVIGDSVIH